MRPSQLIRSVRRASEGREERRGQRQELTLTKGSRVGWSVFGIFLLAMLADSLINGREARHQVQLLRTELEALPRPAPAATLSCSEIWKPRQAFYGCRYQGTPGLKELLSHYRAALQAGGWTNEAFNPMTNTCHWTRGHYTAVLQWHDVDRPSSGWDFAVDLTWSSATSAP